MVFNNLPTDDESKIGSKVFCIKIFESGIGIKKQVVVTCLIIRKKIYI